MKEYTVTQNGAGQRADRFLAKAAPGLPPSALQKAFRKKDVKRNGKPCRAGERLAEGDLVRLYTGGIQTEIINEQSIVRHYRTLTAEMIVYEDRRFLVLHKPAGILSQPDLEEMARAYVGAAEDNGFLPSLCHRLDRNTEGLLLFAKTAEALRDLTARIKNREVSKTYHCVVSGVPSPASGEWRDWLWKDAKQKRVYARPKPSPGAKEAVLRYMVLRAAGGKSLLEINLVTGRTHQIRVQCASRGFPIVGDSKYGTERKGGPLALCAVKLEFDKKVFRIDKKFADFD
ncbi:MAG: RluA family pseudouridine synthase [Oscillospiraceae bacterium]|jgi:23S rRNA pseudouridine955/2504/2580 synthase|nr:RluA family pseudouridine synthase [Oscillospiraceae bacterium]